MREAKKLIEECRQTLAEIQRLIKVLRSMPPDEALKRIRTLSSKDKVIIVDMIKRGEIFQKIKSVRERNPTYIS